MNEVERRWEEGVPHDPRSESLARALADIDKEYGDDRFGFKFGGDGDNGEELMFLLDIYFENTTYWHTDPNEACPVCGYTPSDRKNDESPFERNTPWVLGWVSRAGGCGIGVDPFEYGSPPSYQWRKGWTYADQTYNAEGELPHRVPEPPEAV